MDFTSLYPWVNKNGVYAMTPSCSFEDNVSRHLDIKYEETEVKVVRGMLIAQQFVVC